MHSSHHSREKEIGIKGIELTLCGHLLSSDRERVEGLQSLPPTSLTESLGIHLAHVTHSDDADGGIFLGEDHIERRISAIRARDST